MFVGLIKRWFGTTRKASTPRTSDAGNKAVDLSATILRECIDLGFAGADGPNRGLLTKPFARGYIFGFSDACIQRRGVPDELESLALITLVHAKIFGHKIGSLLVEDALRDRRNAEFGRGGTAGASDLLRWLDDRSYTPVLLTDYLRAEETPADPVVSTSVLEAGAESKPANVSQVRSSIDPSDETTMHAPSRWNTARVKKKAIVEATPDKSAVVIRLHTAQHLKTVKPIER